MKYLVPLMLPYVIVLADSYSNDTLIEHLKFYVERYNWFKFPKFSRIFAQNGNKYAISIQIRSMITFVHSIVDGAC